ncbi:MAG: hypothetical protein KF817_04075 [Phycisphaeraceae bacterium]|nr:hypothetical protein [Phycisphaeraceae bacterium]
MNNTLQQRAIASGGPPLKASLRNRIRLSHIRDSETAILMVEMRTIAGELKRQDPHFGRTLNRHRADWERFAARHVDGGHMLFADGSARHVTNESAITNRQGSRDPDTPGGDWNTGRRLELRAAHLGSARTGDRLIPRRSRCAPQFARYDGGVLPARPDHFPRTLSTWIDAQLDRGEAGRQEINHHLMEAYRVPLRAYVLGSRVHWLGEADDLVAGFFASRLARADFVNQWRESGMRLRRWLMNAMSFYMKEQMRSRRRDQRVVSENVCAEGGGPLDGSAGSSATGAETAFEQAYRIGLVDRALEIARHRLEAGGMLHHFEIFYAQHALGRPLTELAQSYGTTADRAHVMSRTAARHFERAIRELLIQDGIAEDDVEHELVRLLEE